MKIQVLPNNKGQLENPFDGNYRPEQYDDFELANPPLDLTSPNDNVGAVLDAEIVWQYYCPYNEMWIGGYSKEIKIKDFLTRRAFQLTPVKEGEEIETLSNEEFDRQYKEEFGVVTSPSVEKRLEKWIRIEIMRLILWMMLLISLLMVLLLASTKPKVIYITEGMY